MVEPFEALASSALSRRSLLGGLTAGTAAVSRPSIALSSVAAAAVQGRDRTLVRHDRMNTDAWAEYLSAQDLIWTEIPGNSTLGALQLSAFVRATKDVRIISITPRRRRG
jgi:hypothetical protein